ncbi:MAG: hypothetical protein V1877_00055 [Candidatus Tagabacteria bacterium]
MAEVESHKNPPEGEEKKEMKEETGTKTEMPFAEVFLSDVDNRGRFEKLSDKTKDFVGGLYERAKADTVDRAKVMFNDKLFDWHHEKAVLLKFKLESKQEEIRRLENLTAEHETRFKTLLSSPERAIDPKVSQKIVLEKEEMGRMIDKEKGRADRIKSRFEYRSQKEDIYKEQRNRICQNVIEKVNNRLEPYEIKLEALKEKKSEASFEIKKNQEKQKENLEKIKDLENKIKESPFKTERKIYRMYVKEAKKTVKENGNDIKKWEKENLKLGHRVAQTGKKASPWRNKINEFERIAKRGTTETHLEKKEEKAGLAEPAGKETERKKTEELEAKKVEPEEKKAKSEEKKARVEEKEAEKPRWDSISNKERKFWIDKLGLSSAKDSFKKYEGDFGKIPKIFKNQKKYVVEWKKIREAEAVK